MTASKYQNFLATSLIQGGNAAFIEAMYEEFLQNPDSVDDSWRAYFRGVAPAEGIEQPLGAVNSQHPATVDHASVINFGGAERGEGAVRRRACRG